MAADPVQATITDAKVKKHRKSKDEKKKHRKERSGDEETSPNAKTVTEQEPESTLVETSNDAMVVDASSEHHSEASTKEKKKRKREGDESHALEVKASKKDKKRKKELETESVKLDQADGTEGTDVTVSKKDKKKRKRSEADVQPSEPEQATETQAEVSTSKKEKKKKKKERDAADGGEVAAGPSNIFTSSRAAPSSSDVEAFLTKHSVTIHTPASVGKVTPVLSFDQLDIPVGLQSAFKGFKEPTPIQACSWPPALDGRDVVGIAETGSGKTLAFGLPALARLIASPAPQPGKSKGTTVSVLVMAPTRELAIQTHETLLALGEPFGIASVAVFGGVDKGSQIKTLKNANKDGKVTRIIVGTPGRILDLVNDGVCDLSRVTYLVLDEADRMLDKGFENDIRSIIERTQKGAERQTLMFSATWPEAVRKLAASFQRDPVRVTVGSDDLTANSRVEQMVEVFDDSRSKDSRLLGHLRSLSHKKSGSPEDARILVFVLYKKEASRVEGMLRSKGYKVGGLHGDMSQAARMEALQNFKTGTTGLLVATDVAARGLDIPDVAAVINYSFPLTIEDYIHRIGRTGRGGKSGKSITFFTGDNHERALAGELARVLRESGFDCQELKDKFPMTIKKKTHSVYGDFFRDDIPVPTGPTKIKFD